ncbi:thiamine-phosphate synthase 2 [Clostridia bacterium]|nr:thiamine-phosphate synthase 2 [Clostridia bacterium]
MDVKPTLYLVTDRAGISAEILLQKVESALKGGVTMVQLREKDCSTVEYLELARAVHEITSRYHVPLLINDRADIALAAGAEGLHVGTDDMPVKEARKLMGADKIIGATAKTVERAKCAERDGADYLGVGAIFASSVKSNTKITDLESVKDICESVSIPVVAISGINRGNLDVLIGSPIQGIAVITAIMGAADSEAEARFLKRDIHEKILDHSRF